MAFTYKLEHQDGTPPDRPPNEPEGNPVLVVEAA